MMYGLFRFGVDGVFAAEAAVFVHFQLLGRVLLVFERVVVSLLTFVASQDDFDAHFGTSSYGLPVLN